MSQPTSLPRVGFIGAGRLADQIPGCAALDDPQQVVERADVVFLAVPDDSIGTSAHTLRFGPDGGHGKSLVHCSGASPVELLAPARDQGASIGGFHPLYLFGGEPTDLERIAGCSVTIEADGALKDTLTALAVALRCHPLSIPPGGRMLYHGAAHYAAIMPRCTACCRGARSRWRSAVPRRPPRSTASPRPWKNRWAARSIRRQQVQA
ncbi:MAG: Ketopantoate reductase PanG (EC [uncultured Paraburkholderia sp.]|nr:MAG: Ketopantoate reductase PanG (EC [uncultured Paraburkholderia sp.]CAH2924058.1 MAG: Ketopantoate reductase PanG (EC [uncultured Paraburkholderia sp.]CAH2925831.1 MAG: Ketopantoate reductase PanG (EC [uncultured Paraburkholderia sp.]